MDSTIPAIKDKNIFTAEVAEMCNGFIDYCAEGAVINKMFFSACLCDLCGKDLG